MSIEEFKANYEIVFGEPKTTDPGKINVKFNQRQVILKNRYTNELHYTGITVEGGSEEFGEVLVLEMFLRNNKKKDK